MSDHDITHREIYDRLVQVESKVTRIDENTAGMVAAFNAASGAFTVLEFIAKLAKPLLWVMGLGAAIALAWEQLRVK